MTTHPIDTEALRRLADQATPGPWTAYGTAIGADTGPGDCGGCSGILSPAHEPSCYGEEIAGAGEADAEFIAAAWTAIPALLDALDRAEADRDWNLRSSRLAKEGRIKANARADQAEHRATRAEAQAAIRGRAVAIYQDRAREAEARIEAVEAMRDKLHLNYTTMSGPAVAAALTRALDGSVTPPD